MNPLPRKRALVRLTPYEIIALLKIPKGHRLDSFNIRKGSLELELSGECPDCAYCQHGDQAMLTALEDLRKHNKKVPARLLRGGKLKT